MALLMPAHPPLTTGRYPPIGTTQALPSGGPFAVLGDLGRSGTLTQTSGPRAQFAPVTPMDHGFHRTTPHATGNATKLAPPSGGSEWNFPDAHLDRGTRPTRHKRRHMDVASRTSQQRGRRTLVRTHHPTPNNHHGTTAKETKGPRRASHTPGGPFSLPWRAYWRGTRMPACPPPLPPACHRRARRRTTTTRGVPPARSPTHHHCH